MVMAEPAEMKLHRAAVRKRQTQIAQVLAAHGLSRGPRRLLRGRRLFIEDTYCRRLREALLDLGPVFSCFGIYLSSRVDLLPVSYCLELAAIPDLAVATPIASIRQIIQDTLGRSLEDAFIRFENEPFESRLLFQSHRAWLSGAGEVTVKVTHPEVAEWIDADIKWLVLLKDTLAGLELAEPQIDSAIADFRRWLGQRTDLIQEARSLEGLAQDARESEMLGAAIVHTELCSSKVLTVERLQGISLKELVWSFDQDGREAGIDPGYLATDLCLVWLRQALMRGLVPVEPLATNIMILPNQQIAFTGGSFARISSGSKTNLWNYMTSVLAGDADQACECLLTETERGGETVNKEDLQTGFRQAVPFRDGGWTESAGGDSLAEHLFVQWRLASCKGFRPQPHLIGFYRGLFLVATAARRLTAGRDSLREALEELRLIALLAQFREMIGLRQLGESMDKYAAMMMDLPGKLDEVLTLAAEGRVPVKARLAETPARRRQRNAAAIAISLIMVLVSFALLSHHLTATGTGGGRLEGICVVGFVLLGAMLLRVTIRGR